MSNPLPPCRRVVTTHDDEGNAKVWLDEEVKRVSPPGFSDGVSFAVPWVTDASPADCQTVRPSYSAYTSLVKLTHSYTQPIDGKTLKIGELTNEGARIAR